MVTIHFSPDILSVEIFTFYRVEFYPDVRNLERWIFWFFSESDTAQASAARINQRFGVGPPSSAPPPAVSMPGPHQGLGMVVTEEYVIPDPMVGLSK